MWSELPIKKIPNLKLTKSNREYSHNSALQNIDIISTDINPLNGLIFYFLCIYPDRFTCKMIVRHSLKLHSQIDLLNSVYKCILHII